jgi:hypothetical protein
MNCELMVFVIFCQLCYIVKFDMFTDRILGFDHYRCIFHTKLSFPMFPKYRYRFPFPELPFSILFPIKNMKTVMVLVFIDRFHPYWWLLCPFEQHNITNKNKICKGCVENK